MTKILISKDVLDEVIDNLSGLNEPIGHLLARAALKAEMESDPWIPIDEFMKDPVEGLCHITLILNGLKRVQESDYCDCAFLDHYEDDAVFIKKYITHVMPIHKPEPPKPEASHTGWEGVEAARKLLEGADFMQPEMSREEYEGRYKELKGGVDDWKVDKEFLNTEPPKDEIHIQPDGGYSDWDTVMAAKKLMQESEIKFSGEPPKGDSDV